MGSFGIAISPIVTFMRYERKQYERSDGPLCHQPRNKRARVTIPLHAPAPVRLVFAEMSRQGRIYEDLETSSGVKRACFKAWRSKNGPSYQGLSAALNSLGFSFTAIPAIEVLPPEFSAKLAQLASEFKVALPETFAALVEIAADQRIIREKAAERFAEIDAKRAATSAKRSAKAKAAARKRLAKEAGTTAPHCLNAETPTGTGHVA
jgi:hypothetical protein